MAEWTRSEPYSRVERIRSEPERSTETNDGTDFRARDAIGRESVPRYPGQEDESHGLEDVE